MIEFAASGLDFAIELSFEFDSNSVVEVELVVENFSVEGLAAV